MEVEAIIHALHWIAPRGDSRTTHAILLTDSMNLLQKVKSGMGSPDWNVSMVDIHLQKLLWVYCPEHAGVKGNDQADRLAGKATLTSGLLLGRSEVLRSCGHKAKDIKLSIAWRRGALKEEALDYLPLKDERGPSSIR